MVGAPDTGGARERGGMVLGDGSKSLGYRTFSAINPGAMVAGKRDGRHQERSGAITKKRTSIRRKKEERDKRNKKRK